MYVVSIVLPGSTTVDHLANRLDISTDQIRYERNFAADDGNNTFVLGLECVEDPTDFLKREFELEETGKFELGYGIEYCHEMSWKEAKRGYLRDLPEPEPTDDDRDLVAEFRRVFNNKKRILSAVEPSTGKIWRINRELLDDPLPDPAEIRPVGPERLTKLESRLVPERVIEVIEKTLKRFREIKSRADEILSYRDTEYITIHLAQKYVMGTDYQSLVLSEIGVFTMHCERAEELRSVVSSAIHTTEAQLDAAHTDYERYHNDPEFRSNYEQRRGNHTGNEEG